MRTPLRFVLEELMQDLSALTAGTAIVACFVASVVAPIGCSLSRYQKDSAASRALSDLKVRAVMQKTAVSLPAGIALNEALEKFKISRRGGFPVLAEGRLLGIVTQSDLHR